MRAQLVTIAAALTLASCMTAKEQPSSSKATALLADATGGAHGKVTFEESGAGLVVQVAAVGLIPAFMVFISTPSAAAIRRISNRPVPTGIRE